MPEYTREWAQFKFDRPLEMVRRDSLQPGDVAYSSHYGKQTVKDVTVMGDEGQTTHIYWEQPGILPRPWAEIYPSESTVPLFSRAAADPLFRLQRWVDQHINQIPEDPWGMGYHAAVERVQAELHALRTEN